MRLFPGECLAICMAQLLRALFRLLATLDPNATPPSSARKIDLFRADYISGGK